MTIIYLTDATMYSCQEVSNLIHENTNKLTIAYYSVKKSLYICHSNVHAISVDFFGSLAKGGPWPNGPPRIYASDRKPYLDI